MEDEGEGNRNEQGNSVLFDADLIPVKEHRGGSRTGQSNSEAGLTKPWPIERGSPEQVFSIKVQVSR